MSSAEAHAGSWGCGPRGQLPDPVRMAMAMFRAAAGGGHEGGRRHGHRRHGHQGRGGFGGFPFGRFAGPMFGKGGPRMGRGDVRAAILILVAEQPRHGYQLIQEIRERSDGLWRPSPGSVYPTIQQLEDEGLVHVERVEGRRVVELTDAGRAYVEEHHDELAAVWDAVGGVDDSLVELRDLAFQIAPAVMQVAQTGTERQLAEARRVLAETKRALYRILADDDVEGRHEGDAPAAED